MTKTRFERPVLPKDATEEDRRKAMFDALYSLDLSDKLERRENDKLSYLSWANAWAEFKRAYPNAEYRIIKDPTTNLPYFNDPAIGIMVYTEVTADGQTYEMWLPVMDAKNKAMKEQHTPTKFTTATRKPTLKRQYRQQPCSMSTRL